MASNQETGVEHATTTGITTASHPFCDPKCDFVLQTGDNVLFHVHKVILSLVSPVFEGMFSISPMDAQEMHNGRPSIHVSEDSTSLRDFLIWCDPRSTELSKTLESLKNALEVADKYSCDSVIKRIESFMYSNPHMWQHAPLVAYSLSIRFRFDSLAPIAARMCFKIPMSQWPSNPDMGHISGLAMHNLMDYHYKAGAAAASAATDFSWIPRTVGCPSSYFTMPCGSEKDCKTVGAGSNRWLAWFVDYMKAVAERVQLTPVCEMSQDLNLLTSIHSKISTSKCPNCHVHAHTRLTQFSEILGVEINRRIAEVSSKVQSHVD